MELHFDKANIIRTFTVCFSMNYRHTLKLPQEFKVFSHLLQSSEVIVNLSAKTAAFGITPEFRCF